MLCSNWLKNGFMTRATIKKLIPIAFSFTYSSLDLNRSMVNARYASTKEPTRMYCEYGSSYVTVYMNANIPAKPTQYKKGDIWGICVRMSVQSS